MIVNIFSDGGSRGNGNENSLSAWAYTMRYKNEVKENYAVVIGATNNQAELQACIEALKAMKKYDIPVKLHSDSAYVVNGITKWVKGWKNKGWKKSDGKEVLNLKLWQELDSLTALFDDLEYIKVKGHADNVGNNRADELVNIAMDNHEEEL